MFIDAKMLKSNSPTTTVTSSGFCVIASAIIQNCIENLEAVNQFSIGLDTIF